VGSLLVAAAAALLESAAILLSTGSLAVFAYLRVNPTRRSSTPARTRRRTTVWRWAPDHAARSRSIDADLKVRAGVSEEATILHTSANTTSLLPTRSTRHSNRNLPPIQLSLQRQFRSVAISGDAEHPLRMKPIGHFDAEQSRIR